MKREVVLLNGWSMTRAAWEPLARALPADWALQWLWSQPEVSVVLSGMSTMQQVKENLAYANAAKPGQFTAEDHDTMKEVKSKFEAMIRVPCTGCAYCMPCPHGVNIPQNFQIYNELSIYDPTVAQATIQNMMMWGGGKDALASACKACKRCESHCPQKISISARMPEVAEAIGKYV